MMGCSYLMYLCETQNLTINYYVVVTIELCKYCINEELQMADQYCLIIGSYVGGLNSELFLHTDKNHSFFAVGDYNECRKAFAF